MHVKELLSLKGKVILVTGGAGLYGRCIVEGLAEADGTVQPDRIHGRQSPRDPESQDRNPPTISRRGGLRRTSSQRGQEAGGK